jgi:hypothetical protein
LNGKKGIFLDDSPSKRYQSKEPANKSQLSSAGPEACSCKAQCAGNTLAVVLSKRCNAADVCYRAGPAGLPAQAGLGVAASLQAPACLRNCALIPACAGNQRLIGTYSQISLGFLNISMPRCRQCSQADWGYWPAKPFILRVTPHRCRKGFVPLCPTN